MPDVIENVKTSFGDIVKIMMDKFDNDTLIIIGLITMSFCYAIKQPPQGTQIVSNIVSILGGYLGGQYVATKKE